MNRGAMKVLLARLVTQHSCRSLHTGYVVPMLTSPWSLMTSFPCQRVDASSHHQIGAKTPSLDMLLVMTQYFEIDMGFSQLTVEPGYYHMVEEDIGNRGTFGFRRNCLFTWSSVSVICGGTLWHQAMRSEYNTFDLRLLRGATKPSPPNSTFWLRSTDL